MPRLKVAARRSMDVVVNHKHGQRPSFLSWSSVLGDGLLERARATSLGLLGITAAIGLVIVALVFNQAWPLVAGGPVPPLPPRHQGLGEAKVAAGADAGPRSSAADPGRSTRQGGAGGESEQPPPTPTSDEGSSPTPSSELVVAPSAPAETGGDAPRGGSSPAPAPAKPEQLSPAPAQPETVPTVSSPPPPATPAPQPAPPPATVSEAPASYVPPWSNGKGHAYGRSGKETGD